jgi:pyrroloquinoline quinone (PQQ) biosynthesis protein C
MGDAAPYAAGGTEDRPRLRHCTLIDPGDGGALTVVVGVERFSLSEDLGSRESLLRVKSQLDGRRTVSEISERAGVSEHGVRQVVGVFDDLGLLRREPPGDSIPVAEFVRTVDEACDMWSRQIGYHPLFQLLRQHRVRREVFQGWILETYHYVHSARRHVAVALGSCTDARWEPLLTDYFVEEHDHAPLVASALERIGIPREETEGAHPLIGTMSLVNALCEIARADTLSYIACTSLFEARSEDYDDAKQDFLTIAAGYGYAAEDVASVIEHMAGDIAAGHTSLLQQALEGQASITTREANVTVNALHDLKHSFDQYHDQILQYYGDISNYIPRLAVDYFSL